MAALRIFIYVQHLSGVGHTVRMQQVAKALGRKHRVSILDGGRKLPFPPELDTLSVPRIGREGGQLASLEPDSSLDKVLAGRAAMIAAHLDREAADVVLVEHYPFSKWELGEEILAMLAHARAANPALRVVASLRDICPATRHESIPDYGERVLRGLQDFDGLLVHGDPALCILDDYFPARESIAIPVLYTGIVATPVQPMSGEERRLAGLEGPYVVASAGGGRDRAQLLPRVERAWEELKAEGAFRDHSLLLFGGLEDAPSRAAPWPAQPGAITRLGFDPDYARWLAGASLSISCSGYNTCANLLRTGTPALLVPNPQMSDQQERARLLEERGVARRVPAPDAGGDPLAAMMLSMAGREPMSHGLDLNGAAGSLRCLEELLSGLQAD